MQLRSVLLQSTVVHLDESDLALDHPERILDLGPDARLELLDLVDQGINRVVLV